MRGVCWTAYRLAGTADSTSYSLGSSCQQGVGFGLAFLPCSLLRRCIWSLIRSPNSLKALRIVEVGDTTVALT